MAGTEIKVKSVMTDGVGLELTLPDLAPGKYWPSVRKRYNAENGLSRWSSWYTPKHDLDDYAYTVQDDKVRLCFVSIDARVKWYVDGVPICTTSGAVNSFPTVKYFDMERGSVHTFRMIVEASTYPQTEPAPDKFWADWSFSGTNIKDYGGSWTSWSGYTEVYKGYTTSEKFMVCEEGINY